MTVAAPSGLSSSTGLLNLHDLNSASGAQCKRDALRVQRSAWLNMRDLAPVGSWEGHSSAAHQVLAVYHWLAQANRNEYSEILAIGKRMGLKADKIELWGARTLAAITNKGAASPSEVVHAFKLGEASQLLKLAKLTPAQMTHLRQLASEVKPLDPRAATVVKHTKLTGKAAELDNAAQTVARGLGQLRVSNYRGETITREQAMAGLTGEALARVEAGLNLIDTLSARGARGSFGLFKPAEVAQHINDAFLANPQIILDTGAITQIIKILNSDKSISTEKSIQQLNALKSGSTHISDSSMTLVKLINGTSNAELKKISQETKNSIKTTLQEALNSGRINENNITLYQDTIKKLESKTQNKTPALEPQPKKLEPDVKIPKNLNTNNLRSASTVAGKIDRILGNVDVDEPEAYSNPNASKLKINSLEVSVVDRCRQVCDQIIKAKLFDNISVTSAEPYNFDTIFHVFLVQENSDKDVIIDPTYRQFQFNHGLKFYDFSPEFDASERDLLSWNDFDSHPILKIQEIVNRNLLGRPNVLVIEVPKLDSMLDRIKFIIAELNNYPEIPKWNHIFWIKGYIDLCKKKGFSGSMTDVDQVLADYKTKFENVGKDPEIREQKAGRERKLIEYIRKHPDKDGRA